MPVTRVRFPSPAPTFTGGVSHSPVFASVLYQRASRRLKCSRPVAFSQPCLFFPSHADLENFPGKNHLCSLRRHQRPVKLPMEIGVPSRKKPFATVTVGSVTISIIAAPVTIRTGSKPAAADSNSAASAPEFKTYQSFQVAHYEGKRRILQRRNTPEKAKALAREIAGRLHRDGSRAQYFTEKDRRIYTLA